MKEIQTVGIVGLGALGVIFAHQLTQGAGFEQVKVLADTQRTARYEKEGIFLNGERCAFHYADTAAQTEPLDLLLFAVKFGALESAIEECRHLVGPDTTIISALNGISSEQVLSDAFGKEKVVWCVAQKMSAVKEGNRATCPVFGELALGVPAGQDDSRLRALTAFFDRVHFPYSLPQNIQVHMWSKLLCNTGCNQSAMVFQCGYRNLQIPGPARDAMLGAMQEVVQVANAEGVPLSEKDVQEWDSIIQTFPGDGEPSMRQDGKAHRKSEVELFAGTIRRLAAKHGIPVPVNDWLYQQVQEMESRY
ncbi:ketopantoate reductase family protein [Oscillibacter valericigenes]|nr:ketopantoate reductase family protein [Oscillibacter valericigenes]